MLSTITGWIGTKIFTKIATKKTKPLIFTALALVIAAVAFFWIGGKNDKIADQALLIEGANNKIQKLEIMLKASKYNNDELRGELKGLIIDAQGLMENNAQADREKRTAQRRINKLKEELSNAIQNNPKDVERDANINIGDILLQFERATGNNSNPESD